MIVLAKKLIEDPIFENPTVIMLVDRNELESQLFNNIMAVGIEHVEVAESKEHLKNLLMKDKRGLIVSMIHKFENMPPDINKRKNIFVLVDEAHRTTSGKLGNFLMGALPNATYIGFTGTPIDKTIYGQGTFIIFGRDDPPKGYIDKYNIAESIEDGTTLPLHYALAPNELRVDREILDKEFLDLKESEGLSDIEELNKVLERAVNLRNILKNKERINKVSKYISEHFKENVEPLNYKAFLVAVDREACALYKEELNKFLPDEYSKVVFSPFYNDPLALSKYHLSEEEEKRIRKDFLNPEKNPKILIVTNKLLTGFDAPILYCMYLDKPMRDHVLLQTIARVNRPYEDEKGIKKPCGLILDFVGIFENLEKALAFDSTDITGIVEDIEKLKIEFSELINKGKEVYLSILENNSPDKEIEKIISFFSDEDKRMEYYGFFKKISDIYNIISPDAFLRLFIKDMNDFVTIYRILKEAYESFEPVDKEFTKKVEELVRKNTKQGEIKPIFEIYEINENTIREIEKEKIPDSQKVFNLRRSIQELINREGNSLPYLISIGERAEQIIKQYLENQINAIKALEEYKKLIEEINDAKKEQIEKNMNIDVFTVYWILKKEELLKAEEIANKFGEIVLEFPHWKKSFEQERNVKKKFIKILMNEIKNTDKVLKLVNKILLYLKRAEL